MRKTGGIGPLGYGFIGTLVFAGLLGNELGKMYNKKTKKTQPDPQWSDAINDFNEDSEEARFQEEHKPLPISTPLVNENYWMFPGNKWKGKT